MIETLLLTLAGAAGSWLYLVAFALVFAETSLLVGFLLPGETALMVAGAATRFGILHLWLVVTLGVAAAVAGDVVGYEIGRRWGPAVRSSRLGRFVGPRRFAAVDRALERRGGIAVFTARLTAVLRAVMPFAAGSSGMSRRAFLPWNVAGGVVWGTGTVLLGWAFAGALRTVGTYLTWGPPAVLAAVAAGLAARHVFRHRRQHGQREQREQRQAHRTTPA